jgi:hypothetical protein
MTAYPRLLDAIDTRVAELGYHAVSPAERTIFLVCALDAEMTRGSVLDWLSSPSGERAVDTVAALNEIGASRCAAIVEQMLAPFGPDGPPKEEGARVAAIEALEPATVERWRALAAELCEWPDDIDALLRAFIANHVELQPG